MDETAPDRDAEHLRDVNEQLVLHALAMQAEREVRDVLHDEIERAAPPRFADRTAQSRCPPGAICAGCGAGLEARSTPRDPLSRSGHFKQVNDSLGHTLGDAVPSTTRPRA